MFEVIEYTVMDYEGEPVTIEDGEMYSIEISEGEVWNSETCEFEPKEEDDEEEERDEYAPYYGLDDWERNTDWRTWRW